MDEVTTGLAKIAKGAIILGIATAIGKLASILSRIILARTLGPQDYGAYTMIITITGIAATIALLGMGEGVARFLGYHKDEPEKKRKIITTTIIISIVTGSLGSLFILECSQSLAVIFLHDQNYSSFIGTSAIVVLFMTLATLSAAIIRGLENPKAVALRTTIGIPGGLMLAAIITAILAMGLQGIIIGLIITYLVVTVSYVPLVRPLLAKAFDTKIIREIIIFSLPIGVTSIMGLVMAWTDTLMLGYYQGSQAVGVYNVAVPLARQLIVVPSFMGFVYGPHCSYLYAKKKYNEIKRTYQILSKWVFTMGLPLFVIMFAFPRAVVNILFGSEYMSASVVLQILSLIFFMTTILGLNWHTLIAIGETKFIMSANIIGAISNVVLNSILIPLYGLTGAASATGISLLGVYGLYSYKLYRTWNIQPFTKKYIRTIISGLLSFTILKIVTILTTVDLLRGGILFLCFTGSYGILITILKTFDKEDKEIIKEVILKIEKKFENKKPKKQKHKNK